MSLTSCKKQNTKTKKKETFNEQFVISKAKPSFCKLSLPIRSKNFKFTGK